MISFGVQLRNGSFSFDINIEGAIGGETTRGREAFKDEPNLDPWGAFAGLPVR